MDRSKRIRKDRPGTKPGENTISSLLLLRATLLALTLLMTAALCFAAPAPELTDLWDAPADLSRVCNGHTTLLLVCDPGLATCREGAVYFDSKTGMIRDEGVRPAVVLIGRPPEIRETVLDLDIRVPVFIDAGESVFGSILDERVLPALVLMDKGGRVLETIYGGGESLDGNIRALIETETETQEDEGVNWWLIIVPAVAALAILPFVLD
jgi:hypothetical protein